MGEPTDKFSLAERKVEIQALIRATEENRIQMKKAWRNLKKLEAAIQSSQAARMSRQARQSKA
jgi:hypothetical protein